MCYLWPCKNVTIIYLTCKFWSILIYWQFLMIFKSRWSSIDNFFFSFLFLIILIGEKLLCVIVIFFLAIHQHELATVTPVNSPPTCLPTLSIWVVPEHLLWCPASCIELALVICFTYGNVHVSVVFSQIIPPLPSLIMSKCLFFTSMFPLL